MASRPGGGRCGRATTWPSAANGAIQAHGGAIHALQSDGLHGAQHRPCAQSARHPASATPKARRCHLHAGLRRLRTTGSRRPPQPRPRVTTAYAAPSRRTGDSPATGVEPRTPPPRQGRTAHTPGPHETATDRTASAASRRAPTWTRGTHPPQRMGRQPQIPGLRQFERPGGTEAAQAADRLPPCHQQPLRVAICQSTGDAGHEERRHCSAQVGEHVEGIGHGPGNCGTGADAMWAAQSTLQAPMPDSAAAPHRHFAGFGFCGAGR